MITMILSTVINIFITITIIVITFVITTFITIVITIVITLVILSPRHDGWAVAMSGNAHCHLHSAIEGDRTLRIHNGDLL